MSPGGNGNFEHHETVKNSSVPFPVTVFSRSNHNSNEIGKRDLKTNSISVDSTHNVDFDKFTTAPNQYSPRMTHDDNIIAAESNVNQDQPVKQGARVDAGLPRANDTDDCENNQRDSPNGESENPAHETVRSSPTPSYSPTPDEFPGDSTNAVVERPFKKEE